MKKKKIEVFIATILIIFTCANVVSAYSFSISMRLDSATVGEGSDIVVRVNVSNLDVGTNGINSLLGYFKYDTSVFETINESCIEGLNGWTLSSYNPDNGKMVFSKTTFVKSDEDVFYITLRTKQETNGRRGTIDFINVVASNSAQDISCADINTSVLVNNNYANNTTTTNVVYINTTNQTNSTSIPVIPEYTNQVSINGVTLKANDRYYDFEESTIELEVSDPTGDKSIRGVQAEIRMNDIAVPYEVESLDDDWVVTAQNRLEYNSIKFLVEPTEEAFARDTIESNPKVKVHYFIWDYWEPYADVTAWIDVESFKISYSNNEVDNPLKNISDMVVKANVVSGNPVEVNTESGADKKAKIEENNIYVRLNSDPNTGLVPLLQFRELLKFDDSWTEYNIYTDSANGVVNVKRNSNGAEVFYLNGSNSPATSVDIEWLGISLGNIYYFELISDYGNAGYRVHQMGNVYKEDVYVNGVININDVIWLRQGIVGNEEALNDWQFDVMASDVDYSNDELGTIGDVGDVIAIRQRILTGQWQIDE